MAATWSGALWPSAVAIAILLLPGLAVLVVSGSRWPLRFCFAPVVSTALVAVAGVIGGALGVPWNLWSVVALTAVTVVVLAAITRPTMRRPAPGALRSAGATLAGLPVTAAVFVAMYVRPVGDPERFGQLQDTMMHANIVRYILDTQDGSTLRTGLMDGSADASAFYPAAWHDVVSLVVQLTGVSIPVAITAVTAALIVVVLPLSAALLAVALLGERARVAFAAAALALTIGASPWRFLSWGQLYSNLHAMALLPALVGVTVLVCRRWPELTAPRRTVETALIVVGVVGLATAQPNTLFAYGTIVLPVVVAAVCRAVPVRWRTVTCAALLAGFAVGWLVVYHLPFMARTVNTEWPPFATSAQAFGEATLLGFNGGKGQPVVAALVLVGLVLMARTRRHRWWVAVTAFFGLLYVLVASTSTVVRDVLTGFWYHDSYRIAAVVAVLALVPLTLTVVEGWDRFERSAAVLGRRATTIGPPVLVAAAVLALCFGAGMRQQAQWINDSFQVDDAWMVSPAERSFLDRVEDELPAVARVANNPYDGSGIGYALNGLDLLFPTMDGNWLGTWDPTKRVLSRDLDELGPQVCAAVRELGVTHLLQLDDRLYSEYGESPDWAGLRVGPDDPGFTPVVRDDEMALYRIDAC